ncbi:nucleoside hydrolase [Streptomyces sp. NPDC001601]|uniref:nucleoside hydrolase n=1 Tax=Streptomyces sp. NPDC001601 TaxID=3364592 RepID=UPI0036994947
MSSEQDTARHLIVDTDTLGINDDALALHYLFALARTPQLITTVFGNSTATASAGHARALARHHLLDIDVVQGCEKPLWWYEPLRQDVRAVIAALPADTYVASLRPDDAGFWETDLQGGPAPEALAAALKHSRGADVLALGPLTNIARAVRQLAPSILVRHRLFISGGSIKGGNVTEHAEFNAFADPEALKACLSAGWESLVMVPLEVLQAPRLGPAAVDRIRRTDTPLGQALDKLERESPRGESKDREPIWDVVAASVMADDTLPSRAETGTISVDTDPANWGAIRFRQGDGPHRLVTHIDPDAVLRRFEAVVSQPRSSR